MQADSTRKKGSDKVSYVLFSKKAGYTESIQLRFDDVGFDNAVESFQYNNIILLHWILLGCVFVARGCRPS